MRTAILLGFSLSITSLASADPLIEKAASLSTDGTLYAYEMTFKTSDMTTTGKIDPSAPEGKRITVYTPVKEDWPEDFEKGLANMDKNTTGDIWCKEFADLVPLDAKQVAETDESMTFTFNPEPPEDADGMEKKLMKKLEAEITLAKEDGAVLNYSAILPKPYKPAMVAKINTFRMSATCERAPDGRTYMQKFDFEIDGSAMMQDFSETTSRTITKLLGPVG
ncbi:MAG: hypothetical protein AAFR69_11190 [Pseudomonadota bacterium]